MPSFSSLPVAYPGLEGGSGSTTPLPGQTGYLAGTRKRAIGNASFQMSATLVCQLPNNTLTVGPNPIQPQSCIFIIEIQGGTSPTSPLVRMWLDGTAPTTITGLPLYAGQPYEIQGQDDLQNARFVSVDGNQHVLQIQYFSGI